jgi:hypothetical protein
MVLGPEATSLLANLVNNVVLHGAAHPRRTVALRKNRYHHECAVMATIFAATKMRDCARSHS